MNALRTVAAAAACNYVQKHEKNSVLFKGIAQLQVVPSNTNFFLLWNTNEDVGNEECG